MNERIQHLVATLYGYTAFPSLQYKRPEDTARAMFSTLLTGTVSIAVGSAMVIFSILSIIGQ
jgi:hypothetical protein